MKKLLFVFSFSLIFSFSSSVFNSASAQVQIPVPYGSFEQWTTHPGYSINAMITTLQMYDSYTTPTGWGYLAYPVNQTISMGFFNISINTSVPLIVASQETSNVPDGNKAVKLETFMIDDILDPTILSLAADYLDTTMINTVIPSILVTGNVNIEGLMPIMTDMMSNSDSLMADTANLISMLSGFMDTNVNDLITGGIALDSVVPSRLTGMYKYHSAIAGDNGGVVMIGTRWNDVLGKRDVVGGGANINLTDCVTYDSFAVEYKSLHTLDATFPELAPDSLIILIISSASMERQQGSYLCVDNLVLWADTAAVEPPAPDTCASIATLTVVPAINEASLSWSATSDVEGFELEYGAAGFVQGSGTVNVLSGNVYTIFDLDADSEYDVYLRTICNDTIYGDWYMTSFRTEPEPVPDTCARIISIVIDSSNLMFEGTDNMVSGYVVSWTSTFEPDAWETEYGFEGFDLGTGMQDISQEPTISLDPLFPGRRYEFRVRTICGEETYGEWDTVLFMTPMPPQTPEGIQMSTESGQLSTYPNPANGKCVVILSDIQDAELRLYSVDGTLIQTFVCDSNTLTINLPSQGVFLLQLVTPQGSLTKRIVNK